MIYPVPAPYSYYRLIMIYCNLALFKFDVTLEETAIILIV